MANPNSEIWGLPETWQGAKNIIAISGDSENRTQKPRIANFGGGDGSLSAGNTAGKTVINDPIDLTICPCGQDIAISPFARIAVFKNHQDDSLNKIPEQVIETTQPCNWFMYDASGGTLNKWDSDHFRQIGAAYRWSPNATLTGNLNAYITPFVYWQLKSLLISVSVVTVSGYDLSGRPQYSEMPLDDWKNTYNSRKIADIKITVHGVQSANENTIAYYTTGAMTAGKWGAIAPMGELYDGAIDYACLCRNENMSTRLIGEITSNYYASSDYFYMCCYNMFDGWTLKSKSIVGDTDKGWSVWAEIPYSLATYEKILGIAALFACPFTPTDKTTFPTDFIDNDLYIPIIDDDGIAHGEYTHGADNENNDLYNANSVRDKDYDPSKPYDPNIYSDTTTFNDVNFINAFTRRYILNSTQVGELATELWNANATKPASDTMNEFVLDEYLTNNPIDTIVSLKYFPCTFTDVAPAVVYLGKYQTDIAATGLGTSVRVVDFDPINVYRHFGDFRDFEPYTQISVYIPFCGTVTIPTAECMGHYVSVKLAIDTATGAATGFVIVSKSGSGGICVATATGTAAIDIPVSGLQSVNLQQAIFNATANWTQTQISNAKISTGLLTNIGKLTGSEKLQRLGQGFAKGLSTGIPTTLQGLGNTAASLNPFNAMANAAEIDLENAKSNYELQHIEMPIRLIGSASPTLSTVIELQCRLIIYRPITDETALASYADTVGFACLKSGTVSQFSGYTEGTIDVSGINATEQEKAAIAASFASGVYL